LEGSIVARTLSKGSLVIPDVEIERPAANATGELFGEEVGKRWYAGVLNGDRIERFEAVNDAKTFAVFLDYAEPAGAVRRV